MIDCCKPKRSLLFVAFMMVLAAILVLALGGCAWWKEHNGTDVSCQVINAAAKACAVIQYTDATGTHQEQVSAADLTELGRTAAARRAGVPAASGSAVILPAPCSLEQRK